VAFAPDGRTVLSGSADRTLRLWDVATGQQRRLFEGHPGQVNAVVVAPGGRTAASAGVDHTLLLWDLGTGNVVRRLDVGDDTLNALACTADGQTLLGGGTAGRIRLWDIATRREPPPSGHRHALQALAFAAGGRTPLS